MWVPGVDEGLRSGLGREIRDAPGRGGLVTGCARRVAVASGLRRRQKLQEVHITVRDTTLLNELLDLPGITVRGVSFASPGEMVVTAALRRQRLECPEC